MQHLIKLTDAANAHMVLLSVSELEVSQPAIDVVFDLIGAEDLNQLVTGNIVPAGQVDDLREIQKIVFDRDAEGPFIRDGVMFTANGVDLDPDKPLTGSFALSERDGASYMVCDLVVSSPAIARQLQTNKALSGAGSNDRSSHAVPASVGQTSPALTQPADGAATAEKDPMDDFALMMLLHQIGIGYQIDVTKDFPEIAREITQCEKMEWIDIDVKKAAYKLTDSGMAYLKKYLEAAQDLIRRYDIYCDVDVDNSGAVRFDTGLGKDLRVAAWELDGIDPFRARFLLGINDGEWNNLSNWMELLHEKSWYDGVFEPVEQAPSVDEIGKDKMMRIVDEAKAALRKEQEASRSYQ